MRKSKSSGHIIGPYCIIGAEVVLGPNCWLQHQSRCGGQCVAARANKFLRYCSIGQQTQTLKNTKVERHIWKIGDENHVCEFVTVNRSTRAKEKHGGEWRNFFGFIATLVTIALSENGVVFPTTELWPGYVQVGDYAVMVGSQRFTVLPDRTVCHRRLLKNCPGCSAFMIADGNPPKSAALIGWPGSARIFLPKM